MKILPFVLLLTLLPNVLLADSTREDVVFFSEALGEKQNMAIYLPDGYETDKTMQYPVVYFLHGSIYGYEAYWPWLNLQAELDRLIATGVIEPLIFVTPNGLVEPYNGSWWCNSELYGNFEDYLVFDVVEYVDDNYRTLADRRFRWIMGLSAGGFGALKVAFAYPDRFGAVASHSGVAVFDEWIELYRPWILDEALTGPPDPYEYDEHGFFSEDMFALSGACSPNLDNPPSLVDLPLDEDGEIRFDVMERWRPHDPHYRASLLEGSNMPSIYLDCGTNDEYLLYPLNVALSEALDDYGVPCEFQSFKGPHSGQFPSRLPVGLAFLSSTWDPSSVPDEVEPGVDARIISVTAGPEPGIQFQLATPGVVDLDLFSPAGRQIRQLLRSEPVPASTQVVTWDGRDGSGREVASGIYLLRLDVDGVTVGTHKALLVR